MIKKFQIWLSHAPTGREAIILIPSLLFFNLAWSFAVAYLFYITGTGPEAPLDPNTPLVSAIFSLVVAAIIEEPIFRIIPLTIALRNWGTSSKTLWVLIISSILFGLIHGGAQNILLQGMGGFVYGILFIKFSNMGKRWEFSGLLVVLSHFAFDAVAYAIIILGKFLGT